MSTILFIDDEPHNISAVVEILRELNEHTLFICTTVKDALITIEEQQIDLVVTDIFIPMGSNIRELLGPRSRKYEDNLKHLGGLVILDELEKRNPIPIILAHTACTDFALLDVLGSHIGVRIPKPAPVDVLLKAILDALKPNDDRWTL